MASLAVDGRLESIQRTRLTGNQGLGSGLERRGLLGPAGKVALGRFVEGQFLGQKCHLLEVGLIALPLGNAGAQGFLPLESVLHDLLDREGSFRFAGGSTSGREGDHSGCEGNWGDGKDFHNVFISRADEIPRTTFSSRRR